MPTALLYLHARVLSLGRDDFFIFSPQKMDGRWDALNRGAFLWTEIQSSTQVSLWRSNPPPRRVLWPAAMNKAQTESLHPICQMWPAVQENMKEVWVQRTWDLLLNTMVLKVLEAIKRWGKEGWEWAWALWIAYLDLELEFCLNCLLATKMLCVSRVL